MIAQEILTSLLATKAFKTYKIETKKENFIFQKLALFLAEINAKYDPLLKKYETKQEKNNKELNELFKKVFKSTNTCKINCLPTKCHDNESKILIPKIIESVNINNTIQKIKLQKLKAQTQFLTTDLLNIFNDKKRIKPALITIKNNKKQQILILAVLVLKHFLNDVKENSAASKIEEQFKIWIYNILEKIFNLYYAIKDTDFTSLDNLKKQENYALIILLINKIGDVILKNKKLLAFLNKAQKEKNPSNIDSKINELITLAQEEDNITVAFDALTMLPTPNDNNSMYWALLLSFLLTKINNLTALNNTINNLTANQSEKLMHKYNINPFNINILLLDYLTNPSSKHEIFSKPFFLALIAHLRINMIKEIEHIKISQEQNGLKGIAKKLLYDNLDKTRKSNNTQNYKTDIEKAYNNYVNSIKNGAAATRETLSYFPINNVEIYLNGNYFTSNLAIIKNKEQFYLYTVKNESNDCENKEYFAIAKNHIIFNLPTIVFINFCNKIIETIQLPLTKPAHQWYTTMIEHAKSRQKTNPNNDKIVKKKLELIITNLELLLNNINNSKFYNDDNFYSINLNSSSSTIAEINADSKLNSSQDNNSITSNVTTAKNCIVKKQEENNSTTNSVFFSKTSDPNDDNNDSLILNSDDLYISDIEEEAFNLTKPFSNNYDSITSKTSTVENCIVKKQEEDNNSTNSSIFSNKISDLDDDDNLNSSSNTIEENTILQDYEPKKLTSNKNYYKICFNSNCELDSDEADDIK